MGEALAAATIESTVLLLLYFVTGRLKTSHSEVRYSYQVS